ncbi:MAG: ABC transporter ATP-binding protein [Alphaproteobacteria bacterium]
MSTVLKFINICKNFNQAGHVVEVLKDINFSLESSQIVALTGQSGSGKTTLLQLAGLLDTPSSGEIIINNISQINSNDQINTELRKKNIGFIYQFHHLLLEFSVLENVAMPLLIQGIDRKLAYQQSVEILHEVELGDQINYKPSQLSGGQQQRCAIARAIVTKPKLILADEPTGNLDHELSRKVFDILSNLTKKYQIACLIATHNLELAENCDRKIIIRSARLISS